MCGRVVQASDPPAILEGLNAPSSREKPPSYNVAPSQLLYLIRENHDTGERVLGLLLWGLIPHDCTDPDGGRKPINARAEFGRAASDLSQCLLERRCIVPVDCFFEATLREIEDGEWRAFQPAGAALETTIQGS